MTFRRRRSFRRGGFRRGGRRGPRTFTENGSARYEIANFDTWFFSSLVFNSIDDPSTLNVVLMCPGDAFAQLSTTEPDLQNALVDAARGFELAGIHLDVSVTVLSAAGLAPQDIVGIRWGFDLEVDRLDPLGSPVAVAWDPADAADFPVGVTPQRESARPMRILHKRTHSLVVHHQQLETGQFFTNYPDTWSTHARVKLGRRLISDQQVLILRFYHRGLDAAETSPASWSIGFHFSGSLYYKWRT